MIEPHLPYLQWIDDQKKQMVEMLEGFSNINSFSYNLEGLALFASKLKNAFHDLDGHIEELNLAPAEVISLKGEKITHFYGSALRITKRKEAAFKVLLCGHMDTVYPPSSNFQKATRPNDLVMQGPGVADMKGGLVVLLTALKAFEKSPLAKNIGWEVLITPDEEVGSIASKPLLIESAKRCNVGLVFEPALPDGSIVSERKGSAHFTVISKGISAHAGRDFDAGKNAILPLAEFSLNAASLKNKKTGLTVNIGRIEGGGPSNIVPDFAICLIDVRAQQQSDLKQVAADFQNLISRLNEQGANLTLHEDRSRPPKAFDEKHRQLFKKLTTSALDLGLDLMYKTAGGVCDGNTLAGAGLATIDSLGPVGGKLHTESEYVELNTLTERAKLAALLLMRLAQDVNKP